MFTLIARIPARNVQSLVWSGDQLIDWAGGGAHYLLDGTTRSSSVYYWHRFDAACVSPTGTYAVLYERLGTKGIVLKNGRQLREINRSYYHADAYEYPVCCAQLPTGQEVLIHCPDEYDRLEIDDLDTGGRLTVANSRSPRDFFHSRLAVDSKSRYLLSAGWIWHPVGSLGIFSVEEALVVPSTLDDIGEFGNSISAEIGSAAFDSSGHVVLTTTDETFLDPEEYEAEGVMQPKSILRFDPVARKVLSQARLSEPAGTLMPVDSHYAVGFFEHPKLIDLRTGAVITRFTEVNSGKQDSSIIHHVSPLPHLALDPTNRRFAIATEQAILVIRVTLPEITASDS